MAARGARTSRSCRLSDSLARFHLPSSANGRPLSCSVGRTWLDRGPQRSRSNIAGRRGVWSTCDHAEFVRLKVDVIVYTRDRKCRRRKAQATSVIPIIFTSVADPVGNNLVASLARPDGNVTGLSIPVDDMTGKRVEILLESFLGSPIGDLANVVASRNGDERGSGGGPAARPRGLQRSKSGKPRHCARHRGAQEPCGRALCRGRSAPSRQSAPNPTSWRWPHDCRRSTGVASRSTRAV